MQTTNQLPPFATGYALCEQELIACQQLAVALPKTKYRMKAGQAGTRHSRFKGRGMEFAEVRLYQAGDDVRSIDWRVTARTGKTHTKLYNEERERPVLLVADLGQQSRMGSQLLFQSVQIAHICATLSWHAMLQGDRIGIVTTNAHQHRESKPRSRRCGVSEVLQNLLTTYNDLSTSPDITSADYLSQALQRTRKLAKPGSLIWLVADGTQVNQACFEELSQLKRHCEVAMVIVSDPLRRGEVQLPKDVSLPILNGQDYQLLNQHSFHNWLAQQQQQFRDIEQFMQQLRIQVRHVCSGKPLSKQLMELR
tara:strand:+ start:421 stop:1347 length:927 start_codon:yes stop_codon:yes gene_type:complete